jgi:hypothetical protein
MAGAAQVSFWWRVSCAGSMRLAHLCHNPTGCCVHGHKGNCVKDWQPWGQRCTGLTPLWAAVHRKCRAAAIPDASSCTPKQACYQRQRQAGATGQGGAKVHAGAVSTFRGARYATFKARTCSVSALVYLVTMKLVRLTKYANRELPSIHQTKPGFNATSSAAFLIACTLNQ